MKFTVFGFNFEWLKFTFIATSISTGVVYAFRLCASIDGRFSYGEELLPWYGTMQKVKPITIDDEDMTYTISYKWVPYFLYARSEVNKSS